MTAGGEPAPGSRLANTLLVLRAGAIGDFVLTLPALAALRAKYPAHRFLLAARADVLPLVQGTLADDTLPFDSPLLTPLFTPHGAGGALPAALGERLARLDLAVVWLPEASARAVAANLRELDAARLLSASPLPERAHAADHLVDSLAPLGIFQPDRVPHLPLSEETRAVADSFWGGHALAHGCVIALHPGSGGKRKRWSVSRYAALAERALQGGARVLIVRGPAEAGEDWQMPSGTLLLDSPELPLLAAVLSRCALYAGNDSGITHLAAALGVPAIALFGSTDPAVWGPRGAHVHTLRSPSGEMDDIGLETVWQLLAPRLDDLLRKVAGTQSVA